MKILLCLLFLFSSLNLFAKEKSKWALYGTYAPYDTWLFGKFGATAAWLQNDKRSYELAFQRSYFGLNFIIDDLAGVQENRFHLTTRSYTFNGSFNFQYGAYYNSLKVHLGKEYMGGVGAKHDMVELATLGGMWGFGNRWFWENGFSIGVDWFKIFYPFFRVHNESSYLSQANESNEKEDIKDLVDTVSKIPQFTFIHLEIGYRF